MEDKKKCPDYDFDKKIMNLNDLLFHQRGMKVRVQLDCGKGDETVEGVLCNVGTDFFDVRKRDKTVVTIITKRVCKITWIYDDCNKYLCEPCDCKEDNF